MNDPLKPAPSLLCKLGSIIVHAEEMLSEDGHVYDRVAMLSVLSDVEVKEWLKSMGPMIPLKRKK